MSILYQGKTEMGFLRRQGRFAAVAILASALAGTAVAQEGNDLPGGNAGQGIRAGNFIVYPTLELIYQHETNLFLQPATVEPVEASSYVVRPKVMLEMPFLRAYLRAGYMAEYRTYDADEYEQPDRWTHIFVLNASVRATNGITSEVRARHVRTTLYTEEFDANREVQFGNLPFVKNSAEVEFAYRMSPRMSAGLFGGFRTVRFDDDVSATRNFFDYTAYSAGARGAFRLTPLTKIFLDVERTVSERDRAYQAPGLADDMKSTATIVRGGVSGGLTPTLSGQVFFGYKRSEYENAPDPTLTRGEFGGLVYGLGVSNRFSPQTTLEGRVWREENQSASLGSNYYVTTGGTATITHYLSRGIFTSLGLMYQQNSYAAETPTFGILRDDDLYSIRGGLGFYFNERASVRVNYQYRTRDSNIPMLDYKTSVYTVQAQIGW